MFVSPHFKSNLNIQITPMRPNDLPRVARVHLLVAPDDTHREWMKNFYTWINENNPRGFEAAAVKSISKTEEQQRVKTYVVKENGNVVGSLTLAPFQRTMIQPLIRRYSQKDTATLIAFGVLKEARGQGYGKALLAYVEQEAIKQGYKRLVFNCSDKNVAMYEHLGYKKVTNPLAKLWFQAPLLNLIAMNYLGYNNLMSKDLTKLSVEA